DGLEGPAIGRRRVADAIGVEREQRVGVVGRRHADRRQAGQLAGVAPGLVLPVHEDARQLEFRMSEDGAQRVASDVPRAPLDHPVRHVVLPMARFPALWDASRMADLEALVRLMTRGAEAARGEARRILDELVARGDLSRAEADEALARVQEAVDANRRWLDERVVSPLRDALRGAGGALRRALDEEARPGGRREDLLARLAALEARLARVEARLEGRGAPGRRCAGRSVQLGTLVKLPQTYRSLARVREILAVVAKYGFGDLVARLELETALERGRNLLRSRRNRRELVRYTTEERIRLAFEELGPTFVKLGQILATRPDFVPMSLVQELRKLQDAVPPFPTAEARRQIEGELGRPLEQLFARFDERPLAAASIAQVHRAWLPDGESVVVKVRRPNLESAVRTDVEILRGLAGLLEENAPEPRQYQPAAIVEEFAHAIGPEVDLRNEAYNLPRFAANFAGDRHVHVPRVHLELSTEKVLVMEYVDGIKASDLAALDGAGIDRKRLAAIGVEF